MDWDVGSVPTAARGLRVLLVDCNPAFLLYIAALLEINYYKVTTAEVAAEAMSWIVERKMKFDIIIVEVKMPRIDGFVFLEHILRQVNNIPIILMSEDPSGELANRALQKGASFFFDKPIPNRHIINVWQHYYRVKKCPNSQTEKPSDKRSKRKTLKQNDGQQDNSSKKKRDERMKWTPELHLKFVNALAKLGNQKPHPRKIVELIDVPYVKVRHVSSHLQKYRERLKQLNGDNSLLNDISTMQIESPSNLEGVANNFMLPQTREKSVHLTVDTLRDHIDFMNFNPKSTPQYKGKGKRPMEPEIKYGNMNSGNLNFSGFTIANFVDQEVNIFPPVEINYETNNSSMELYELSKILEEDNFDELGNKLTINEDIVTEWGQLLAQA